MKNKSNFMFISIVVLSILTLIILILSCIHIFVNAQFDMSSWIMVATLGVFTVMMIVCIVLEKFHVRKMGFYLLHIGLILILIGCFMYFIKGEKYQLKFPINMNGYTAVTTEQIFPPVEDNGEVIDLLMDVRIMDAKTTYYDSTYTIYTQEGDTNNWPATETGLELKDGYLDLSQYGGTNMSEAALKEAFAYDANLNAICYYITPRSVLCEDTPVAKHYEVSLSLYSVEEKSYYGTASDPLTLTVNHPVRCGDWKVYLQSIHADGVVLLVKKDPGESVTVAGIILLIVGSFMASFMRPAKAKTQNVKAEAISAPKAGAGKRKGVKR